MAAIFSRRASAQLESIIGYIASSSPQNARKVLERVEKAVDFIARNPRAGPVREDLGKGTSPVRTWPVPPVILVYRERNEGGAEIVVVAHGHQLIQALLEDET